MLRLSIYVLVCKVYVAYFSKTRTPIRATIFDTNLVAEGLFPGWGGCKDSVEVR